MWKNKTFLLPKARQLKAKAGNKSNDKNSQYATNSTIIYPFTMKSQLPKDFAYRLYLATVAFNKVTRLYKLFLHTTIIIIKGC